MAIAGSNPIVTNRFATSKAIPELGEATCVAPSRGQLTCSQTIGLFCIDLVQTIFNVSLEQFGASFRVTFSRPAASSNGDKDVDFTNNNTVRSRFFSIIQTRIK
jgi:hypothetical protein